MIININDCDLKILKNEIISNHLFYPIEIKDKKNQNILFFEEENERKILRDFIKKEKDEKNIFEKFSDIKNVSKNEIFEIKKGKNIISKEEFFFKVVNKNEIDEKKIIFLNSIKNMNFISNFFDGNNLPKTYFYENSEQISIFYDNNEFKKNENFDNFSDVILEEENPRNNLHRTFTKDLKTILDLTSITL